MIFGVKTVLAFFANAQRPVTIKASFAAVDVVDFAAKPVSRVNAGRSFRAGHGGAGLFRLASALAVGDEAFFTAAFAPFGARSADVSSVFGQGTFLSRGA